MAGKWNKKNNNKGFLTEERKVSDLEIKKFMRSLYKELITNLSINLDECESLDEINILL